MTDESRFDTESTTFRLLIIGGLVLLVLIGMAACVGISMLFLPRGG